MQALYTDTLPPQRGDDALEASLKFVETHLAALGVALRDRDLPAIDSHASALHSALAAAVQRFQHAARHADGLAPALRQRLALASGQVAAQRESLARATAALDRAIDVLLPAASASALYGEAGHSQRPASSGCLNA